MRKKTLSLFFALVLCLGLFPVSVSGTWDTGKVQQLALGDGAINTSAVVDGSHSLWMWGLNNYGQLGLENVDSEVEWDGKTLPAQTIPVKIMDNVKSVSISDTTTAVIKMDDSLWMWGRNHVGELGNGTTEDSRIPIKVMDDVAAVDVGGSSVAAIKKDGSLWTWGHDCTGQSKDYAVKTPIKIMDDVKAVSVSVSHCAAIKTDGSLWTWGSNYRGALGNGGSIHEINDITHHQATPVKVMDNVKAVGTDSYFTAALKNDGTVWTWGDNIFGALGNGRHGELMDADENLFYQNKPAKVLDGVDSISVGGTFVAAIKTDGSLWTWGYNSYYQLGNGGGGNYTEYNAVFQLIPAKVMDHIAMVCAGEMDALAIDTDGKLWVWGFNSYGQTGALGSLHPDSNKRVQVILPDPNIPAVFPEDSFSFTDVPAGQWYTNAVNWAVTNSITNGTGNNQFSPAQGCTQEQILTFLYRATRGSSTASAGDMAAAVDWAREKGMVNDAFDGKRLCTRSTAVSYIWQALGKPSAGSSSFSDVATGAPYADAVDWAVEIGVTEGTGNGQFSPDKTCTRGEIVTFLYRAYH